MPRRGVSDRAREEVLDDARDRHAGGAEGVAPVARGAGRQRLAGVGELAAALPVEPERGVQPERPDRRRGARQVAPDLAHAAADAGAGGLADGPVRGARRHEPLGGVVPEEALEPAALVAQPLERVGEDGAVREVRERLEAAGRHGASIARAVRQSDAACRPARYPVTIATPRPVPSTACSWPPTIAPAAKSRGCTGASEPPSGRRSPSTRRPAARSGCAARRSRSVSAVGGRTARCAPDSPFTDAWTGIPRSGSARRARRTMPPPTKRPVASTQLRARTSRSPARAGAPGPVAPVSSAGTTC